MKLSAKNYSPVVLSTPLASVLCREPWTGAFTVKAYRKGFKTISDLVGHTDEEIFSLVPTSAGNRERILAALKRVSYTGP